MATDAATDTHNAYALIGAGPMGLAMARNLAKHNIPFQGFELHSGVGGLWDIDAPRSTMYESAHLISSRTTTEFSEFPMAEGVAEYPSHREMKRYFNQFADQFDLHKHYHFNCEVLATKPLGNSGEGWEVSWRDGDGQTHSAVYKGVLIANGTLSEPNMPTFNGEFAGELIHSSQYRYAEVFKDKRVLIVGAGNSGCDIAVDAINHGIRTDLSMRRGYYFVPKYVFGKPADTVGGAIRLPMFLKQKIDGFLLSWFVGNPQKYGFPKPDYKLYEAHPVVNSLVLFYAGHGDISVKADIDRIDGNTVVFRDGEQADYDMIVAATGYRLHYPFIDQNHLNWQGDAPSLYLNCFHPQRDDVFLLGMVEASGLGWQGRYEQAELVARYIKGLAKPNAAIENFQQSKQEPFDTMRGGMNYLPLERMAYYVHKDTYRKALLKHIAQLSQE